MVQIVQGAPDLALQQPLHAASCIKSRLPWLERDGAVEIGECAVHITFSLPRQPAVAPNLCITRVQLKRPVAIGDCRVQRSQAITRAATHAFRAIRGLEDAAEGGAPHRSLRESAESLSNLLTARHSVTRVSAWRRGFGKCRPGGARQRRSRGQSRTHSRMTSPPMVSSTRRRRTPSTGA